MADTPFHIHFVEDEEEMQTLFNFNFRKEIKKGIFKISFSNNGQECLDFMKTDESKGVGLVLSDINMPVMDGLTLLENMKKEYSSIPIYMVSAYETDDYINKAKELGAENFVSKPVDFKDLKNLIYKEFDISPE